MRTRRRQYKFVEEAVTLLHEVSLRIRLHRIEDIIVLQRLANDTAFPGL